MTTLHGGYDYCFFISFLFLQMSAVINTQVVLNDVRNTDIQDVKRAVAFGLRLNEDESHLVDEIFNINLSKIIDMHKPEFDQLRQIELQYLQCQLILKISKKIKLLMSSLEDYIGHDLMVETHFQYDEPQQVVFAEIQQYLNQMRASEALNQIL